MRFFGLDLTTSPRWPLAFAVLDEVPRALDLGYLMDNSQVVGTAHYWRPCLVAIDAPLGLPHGLCCLEETCPCIPLASAKGRACERELARQRIGCFFTTKRSIIKAMVYWAMALRRALEKEAVAVLEVFPYATKVRLFGRLIPRKTSPEGLAFLKQRLSELVDLAALPGERRLDHNLWDALAAAYTAYLYHRGQAEALGLAEEGQNVLPLLEATETPQ